MPVQTEPVPGKRAVCLSSGKKANIVNIDGAFRLRVGNGNLKITDLHWLRVRAGKLQRLPHQSLPDFRASVKARNGKFLILQVRIKYIDTDMVQSAYSTGKPALGVGPGNVPCYIHRSANVRRAATDLMMSKTFDNGMICASEQAVIVDAEIAAEFEDFMKENACVFLTDEETKKLESAAVKPGPKPAVVSSIVGQSAYSIAKLAGIDVPKNTKILLAKLTGVGPDYPLSVEKLSPILAYYIVNSTEEGTSTAERVIEFGGLGHSAVVHG